MIDCPSDNSAIKREQIKQMLSEGYGKKQIRSAFIEMYGYEVLATPPLRGFNILAWVLPFVAMAGAGYMIKKFLQNAVPQSRGKKAKVSVEKLTTEDEERLQDEMKKYL